jgi:calcium-dependent protein kinase
MRYCHERSIVHRDLKPENIVYLNGDHEELVIIDFGDAKEVEEHSSHDDFVGTAFYLAPEAIRTREGWELKKSDMWTIGVIAYVLVTGRPPFWGRENKEIIRKIVGGNVRFPSTIKLSDECKDFILSLLQKPPDKRLSAAEALKHHWITGESVSAIGEDILFNLATFGTSNQLKQLIVKTVAANLDRKHRKEYEQQFINLDLQNDQILDYEELTLDATNKAKRVIKHISGDANTPISKQDWNHSNVAKLLSSDHLIERQYKSMSRLFISRLCAYSHATHIQSSTSMKMA